MSLRRKPVRHDDDLADLPPEERVVAHATARALGEQRVKWTDRRLLIIFVLLVAIVAYIVQDQRSFKAVERRNCQSLNRTIAKIDHYSDNQAATVRRRTDLSPAAKAATLKNFADFRIPLQVCP